MESLLETFAESLQAKTDLELLALLDEVGKENRPALEKISRWFADKLIEGGEDFSTIWNGNQDRIKLIGNEIAKEAARRWRDLIEKTTEYANQ
jgi:hypothetical protein